MANRQQQRLVPAVVVQMLCQLFHDQVDAGLFSLRNRHPGQVLLKGQVDEAVLLRSPLQQQPGMLPRIDQQLASGHVRLLEPRSW